MVLLDIGSFVAPGWLALVLVVVIGLAIVGLFFSMRKHLRGINAPVDDRHPDAAPFADGRR